MTYTSEPNDLSDFASDEDIWGGSSSDVEQQVSNNHSHSHSHNRDSIEDTEDYYGSLPHPSDPPSILALRRIHAKQGYLAGLSAHKEETLQRGFDEGYPEGADLALQLGDLIGKLHALSYLNVTEGDLKGERRRDKARESLEQLKKEVGIRKVLSGVYYDEELGLKDGKKEHPLIMKWKIVVQDLVNGDYE